MIEAIQNWDAQVIAYGPHLEQSIVEMLLPPIMVNGNPRLTLAMSLLLPVVQRPYSLLSLRFVILVTKYWFPHHLYEYNGFAT